MSDINNIWQYIATTSLGIIISMATFWLTTARHMVHKDEVSRMIETQSPYIHDKQFIMERLAVNKETQAQFSLALQRNADVMNELRLQLATLGKTLETLEERIERHGNV